MGVSDAGVANTAMSSEPHPSSPSQGSKYGSLISRGRVQGLCDVPFHDADHAPLLRRVLTGDDVQPQAEKRIVAHELNQVPPKPRDYCKLHVHPCPEINLLLTSTSLTYEIRLGDEIFLVDAPASIYIPPGLPHSANVFQGSGFYIAMIEASSYIASAPEEFVASAPEHG